MPLRIDARCYLVQQHPRGICYSTLATAEFHIGNLKEAIATSRRSVELFPQEDDRYDSPYAGEFAILAMSYFKLRELEKANEYRAKHNEAMKLDAFKGNEECKSCLAEVEALFDLQGDDRKTR